MGKRPRKSSSSKPDKRILTIAILDAKTLSEQIDKLMIAQRMPVDQVAKRAKMTGERLAELREEIPGRAYPTADEIRRLARALNTKPTSLVYWRG